MSLEYNFKKIQTVLGVDEFIDATLSKIQRKSSTVIRRRMEIVRIREFYLKKVRFAQLCFKERFETILAEFPKLDEIHPFYTDLLNVLYDRDHYKIALGQISKAKRIIDTFGKEYMRMLKYAESLYQCKRLKIAALGRMVQVTKKMKNGLKYLEEVRQHLSRMPSIDPTTRTLLLCGYPNVGKSSFMNRLTRANVDVQPYPFTTKTLYVGHMKHNHLDWQIIDTPGILDRPLEDRNTIEMQAITALAHLRCCILYFFDLSESCGYSAEQQALLFLSLQPLFSGKRIVLLFNKTDLLAREHWAADSSHPLQAILESGYTAMDVSALTSEGVFEARGLACDTLLEMRLAGKADEVAPVLNRLHVAVPLDIGRQRKPNIPESVRMKTDIKVDHDGLVDKKDNNINLKEEELLKEEEKYDIIPEIMNGKNLLDFVGSETQGKLQRLVLEEEYLHRMGEYVVEPMAEEEKALRVLAEDIARKRGAYLEKRKLETKHGASTLRKKIEIGRRNRAHSNAEDELDEAAQVRERLLAAAGEAELKDKTQKLIMGGPVGAVTGNIKDRRLLGIGSEKDIGTVNKLLKRYLKKKAVECRVAAGDRSFPNMKPKHLFSGKMSAGKRRFQ